MKKHSRLIIIITLFLILISSFTMAACVKGNNQPQTPTNEIKLNVNELNLRLYSEYTLSVRTSGNFSVQFVSDNEQVASVTANGVITANGVGTATITAKFEDASDTLLVTVFETTEIPTINFLAVDESNVIRIMEDDVYNVKPSVYYDGEKVDATLTFEVEDDSVVSVSGEGVVSALKAGEASVKCVATYKKWTIEKTFNVEVVGDTAIMLSKYTTQIYSSDIIGHKISDQIESAQVYENGQLLDNQPEINWSTQNPDVATVQDGVITAVGAGQTHVIASVTIGGKEYTASCLVVVKQPELDSVTNIRVEDEKLKWDSVDYCDGYKFTANLEHEDLKVNEYDVSKLYGKVEFTITPYSNNSLIKDGNKVKYNTTFTTADITEKTLITSKSAEASVITKIEEYTEEDVYFCDVNSNSFAMGQGGIFKVLYMTPWFESRTNPEGKQPFKDVKAIVDNDYDLTEYREMTITFWAYGYDEDVAFVLGRTSGTPSYEEGAEFYSYQIVPMREWTKVELLVTDSDIYTGNYNLFTAILASGDFYYTDVRINTLTHESTVDHSDCGFFAGMYFNQAVNALPESMPDVSSENFIEFENDMLFALNEYSLLTEALIEKLSDSVVEKFKSLKIEYAEYLISILPDVEDLTLYQGETINRIASMLIDFSETERAGVEGIEKFETLKEEYDKNYIVAFDTYSPWLYTETNAYKRVDLGVNSYLATVNYSVDRTYFEQYGTVTKAEVLQGETSGTEDRTNHLHSIFNVQVLKTLLEENASVLEVRFSILTSKGTNWEINKVGSKKQEERVWENILLTNGSWTEISINREDVLTSNGAFRRAQMTIDGAKTIYFTNFYLIKSDAIVAPIIEKINSLPQNHLDVDVYDGSTINSAYTEYMQLPNEYKLKVANAEKLLQIKEYYDANYAMVNSQDSVWLNRQVATAFSVEADVSIVDDETYGLVLKYDFTAGANENKTMARGIRWDMNFIKTYFNNNADVDEIKFLVYSPRTTGTDEFRFYEEGNTTNELEQSITKDVWNEVTITRSYVEGVTNTLWLAFRPVMPTTETTSTAYISCFYAVKSVTA